MKRSIKAYCLTGQPCTQYSPQNRLMRRNGGALDFYVATNHSEYLGVLPAMDDAASQISVIDYAKDMFSSAPDKIAEAFGKVFMSMFSGKPVR